MKLTPVRSLIIGVISYIATLIHTIAENQQGYTLVGGFLLGYGLVCYLDRKNIIENGE